MLPPDFPKSSGAARNAYMLGAIDDGRIVPVWCPLTVSFGGHTATFQVLGDALKLGGTRLSTSASNLQQIADKLRASLMTPRLIDLAFLHASVQIAPQTSIPDDSTAALEKESQKIDDAILHQTGALGTDGIIAPIGKNWVLSNALLSAKPGHAALYGWAAMQGYVPPPGVGLYPGTLPGVRNIQPLATPHDLNYTDYAMLTSLVRRDVMLDGRPVDLWSMMQSPDLSIVGLVSHEGPLRVLRQPGVPTLPPIGGAPVTTMTSGSEYGPLVAIGATNTFPMQGPWGRSATGKPLAVGTQVQIKQHDQHVAKQKHLETTHPARHGAQVFFWHLMSIPLTTVVGITIGKLIEKHKAKL